jgi:REP element-mobilizing transposase RayT
VANTYTSLHYHVIFSTKNRERWIAPDIEGRMWAYLGGIARQNDFQPLCIGGVEDHVHLLLALPPVVAVSEVLKLIKGGSSGWVKETSPNAGVLVGRMATGLSRSASHRYSKLISTSETSATTTGLSRFRRNTKCSWTGMDFNMKSDICGIDPKRRYATPGFLRRRFRGLKLTATFAAPRRGATEFDSSDSRERGVDGVGLKRHDPCRSIASSGAPEFDLVGTPFCEGVMSALVSELWGERPGRLDRELGRRICYRFVAERRGEGSRGLQSTDCVLQMGGVAERRMKPGSLRRRFFDAPRCGAGQGERPRP